MSPTSSGSGGTQDQQVAEACAELARRLRAGQDCRAEELLAARPELAGRREAALELLRTEFLVRRELGQQPAPARWLDRFPHWHSDVRRLLEDVVAGDPTVTPGAPTPVGTIRPPGPPAADLPERFGRYRILRRLGQGGMGSVYLAHDTDLDRRVALKVPQLAAVSNPVVVERFQREARAVAALDHPGVCPVYDVGFVGGVPYLTLAFLEGEPLSERLRGGKPLPQREAAALVRQLAEALAYAHRQGVVHRDLKPANVMITPQGRPVLVDFGLALRLDRGDDRLTVSGAIAGTPAYLAPEQADGRRGAVGPASDIYSLGVVLYELLTGRPPFSGWLEDLLVQVLEDEPPPPRTLRPDLDPRLEAICLRAMAKAIAARYASMDEMAAARAAYLDPPARRWRRVAVAGLGGLALAAVLLWQWPAARVDPGERGDAGKRSDQAPLAAEVPQPARLLMEQLKHADVRQRTRAAENLKAYPAQPVVAALVARVADERWEGEPTDPSKAAALATLRGMAPDRVRDALDAAARSANPNVRDWARAELQLLQLLRPVGGLPTTRTGARA